jgi:hypothetical protein
MSSTKHSDQPISAEDLRLVEALYGESPDSEVDDVDLLEGYRDLRAMFADLPDEAPPGAASARLMSAAAETVKARAPDKLGLWERLLKLFAPLTTHPALAAAASLVLVATIGGVLVMSGRSKVAEPDTSSATETTGDTAVVKSPDELEKSRELEVVPGADPADRAEGEREEKADTATIVAEPTPPPTTGRPAVKQKPKPKVTPSNENRRRGGRYRSRVVVDGKLEDGAGSSGKTGIEFGDVTSNADSPEPEPEPGPEPRRTEATAVERQQATRVAAEVESLTSRARRAAVDGDCGVVQKVAGRIRELDRSHHDALVSRDAKIRSCLTGSKKVKTKK